jgi:cytoplasmic iron level regulating protein YaaA (DUF328/UPF0246 family)
VLYVLVPPSEGKAEGGTGRWKPTSGAFGRRLGASRAEVVEALGRTHLGPNKLNATGALLERAQRANEAVAAGRARARPAHERFTGVVWEHLGAPTLDDDQRSRTLVPSALLGLLTANDPVPDHRCKLDVSLDGIGRLDRFWRPHVTDAILKRTTPHDTIVELLPNEHRNAIDLDRLAKRRRVVRTTVAGIGGHDAKAVKGALARHLLLGHDADADADAFDWYGWSASLGGTNSAEELTVSRR